MKYLLYTVPAVLGLLLGWMLLAWDPEPSAYAQRRMLEIDKRPSGGDFSLQSWRGTVSLTDFRGSVVLLYFGYTWCPDVCPTSLGYISLALDRLNAAELEQVQVLFISVDPERDTLERLKKYTAFFHARVLGITGSPQQLYRTARQYGAAYRKVEDENSSTGYLVDHSSYTYLIGPDGTLHGKLEHGTPPDRISKSIRRLLTQTDRQE